MALSGHDPDDTAIRELSDTDLVQRLQSGDEQALAELYRRFGGLVYSIAYRVVGDHALAEEIMQDAFLNCWNKADSFRPAAGRVAPWLSRIARNRAIDVVRGRQHQARLRERTPLAPLMHMSSADHGDEVVFQQTISEAVAELPESQRTVVELAYYGGKTQSEIARDLDQPLGTVKSRTRSAMRHLRQRLQSSFSPSGREASAND
ncbi:sigma-70 family RNA polymerase sigma factor [soil metagenome]